MDPALSTVPGTRMLARGVRLGRYRIVERFGAGGMAEIYLAVVEGVGGFEKRVALKLVHAHAVNDPDRATQLLREAKVAATLEHPNIAQVLDVGEHHGEYFLAMEYVHGRDVGEVLRARGRGRGLPLDCALYVVAQACRGLHYAHTRIGNNGAPLGLVHRDISPSNVLLSYDGAVKVTDFGIAKVDTATVSTEIGVLKGKFGYMSPEQSRGEALDCRSDVFALGILLYEVTLGRRAFVGNTAFAIMNDVLAGKVVPPRAVDETYPPELEAIVLRALAPAPSERYASAAALEEALLAFARRHDLDLRADRLSTLMEELFGRPEVPDCTFDGALDSAASMASATATASRTWRGGQGSGRRISAALVFVAAVAGGAGWWMGNGAGVAMPVSSPSVQALEQSPTPPHTASAAVVQHEESRTPPQPVATVEADPAVELAPPADESERADETSRARTSRGEHVKAKRRPARKRARKRASATTPSSPPRQSRDLDAMFPAPLR